MSKILIIEDAAAIRRVISLKFQKKTIPIMEDAEDGAAGHEKNKKITITIWSCAISKCQNGWC
jgi:CheY-like chemotaxis protein